MKRKVLLILLIVVSFVVVAANVVFFARYLYGKSSAVKNSALKNTPPSSMNSFESVLDNSAAARSPLLVRYPIGDSEVRFTNIGLRDGSLAVKDIDSKTVIFGLSNDFILFCTKDKISTGSGEIDASLVRPQYSSATLKTSLINAALDIPFAKRESIVTTYSKGLPIVLGFEADGYMKTVNRITVFVPDPGVCKP